MDDQRWETAALRESQARRRGRPGVSQDRRREPSQPPVWVTLREASDATGIPVGTLGSWARRGTVDSYLEGNGGRKLRIVELNDVRVRARELGRPVSPVPVREVAPSASGAERSEAEGVEPRSRQRSNPPPGPDGPDSPLRGEQMETMIVPLDAWNKMLNQLGNLHEAGQQLAEARERAAKAETEALFLRERLAEMRDASPQPPVSSPLGGRGVRDRNTAEGDQSSDLGPLASAERSEAEGASSSSLWQYLYRTWKSRGR